MNKPRLTSAVMRGIFTYTGFLSDIQLELDDRPKARRDVERVQKYFSDLIAWYYYTHPDFNIRGE